MPAYIDSLTVENAPPGIHRIAVEIELDSEAEKRMIAAIREGAGRPAFLRAFCIALCPELDPVMQQAVAAVSKATDRALGKSKLVTPDAHHKHTGYRKDAPCYNCGNVPSYCICPKGLVPQ